MHTSQFNVEPPVAPTDDELKSIERLAVELANLAGAEILTALGGMHSVRYKSGSDEYGIWRNPVSEVDSHVEVLIRARLADKFPDHDIIGEEMDDRPGRDHDFIWAVDPIDGTTNFVNGFPLFAASIGVLFRGVPVAGAVWCATSHKLRAGVYHARRGGKLKFNDETLTVMKNPTVRRGLAGIPKLAAGPIMPWESRKTGSAAIECAFTAAGLLRVSRFEQPNLWDVAGGIPLVLAAGGVVQTRGRRGWELMKRFETSDRKGENPDLRNWRQPLILGQPEAVEQLRMLY
jgi:myo-inositol-1(or 4)-monophosphatase